MINYSISTIVFFALSCAMPAVAQEASDEAPDKKALHVRVLACSIRKGAESLVIKSGKSFSDEFEVTTHGLSPLVPLSQRGIALGLAPKNDEQPFRPLMTVKLPDEGSRFLLLLIPTVKGYSGHVVRLDGNQFQGGDILFYNLSGVSIGGIVAGKKFVLPKMQMKVIKAPKENGKPYYQVRFYYNKEGSMRVLRDGRWPFDERARSYVFFYTDPKTQRVSYRSVDEFIGVRK